MLTELFNLMVGTLRKEHGNLAVPEGKKNLISEEYEAERETKQKKADDMISPKLVSPKNWLIPPATINAPTTMLTRRLEKCGQ